MFATRRNLMAAVAVLPIASCPSPTSAVPSAHAGVSAKLAELIDGANDSRDAHGRHYREIVEPLARSVRDAVAGLPHVTVMIRNDATFWTTANTEAVKTARSLVKMYPADRREHMMPMRKLTAASIRRNRAADRIRRDMGIQAANDHNEDLLKRTVDDEWEVANFPAASPADFHAKVAFMVERQMFDGIDHSEMLMADATRLAGEEA